MAKIITSAQKLKSWIEKYENDPRVKKWLSENPPPKNWKGDAILYAFTEMPVWVVW